MEEKIKSKKTKYWISAIILILAGIISIFTTDGDWTYFILCLALSGSTIYGLIFDPEALEEE